MSPDRDGSQGRVGAIPDVGFGGTHASLSLTGQQLGSSSSKGKLMNDVHQSLAHQGLVRPRDGRVLGGVCAGLGQRFGWTPWSARILFVLLLMVVPGSQLLIYPILWILMPSEDTVTPAHRASW